MKYIRTPEGIFEFAKRFDLEHYRNVGYTDEDIARKFIRNGNKLADTIEELCDEFVLEHPLFAPNCKTLYHSLEKAKNGIKKHNDDAHKLYPFTIYGAIWTSKGLIYIAKMNDKGELELL